MDRNFDVSTVYVVSVGQARKSLWIETLQIELPELKKKGQARKSLWIETVIKYSICFCKVGQARKSLWIETLQYWWEFNRVRSGS